MGSKNDLLVENTRLVAYPTEYHFKLFVAECDLSEIPRTEALSSIIGKKYSTYSDEAKQKLITHYEKLQTEIKCDFKQIKTKKLGIYNNKLSVTLKAEYIIKEKGFPLSVKEIVKYILVKEPELDREALRVNLSVSLVKQANNNIRFTRFKNTLTNYVYGLIEWKQTIK